MRLLWLKMYTPIVDSDAADAPNGHADAPGGSTAHDELVGAHVTELFDDVTEVSRVAPPHTLSVRHPSVDPPTTGAERSVPQSLRELRFGHSVPTSSWESS